MDFGRSVYFHTQSSTQVFTGVWGFSMLSIGLVISLFATDSVRLLSGLIDTAVGIAAIWIVMGEFHARARGAKLFDYYVEHGHIPGSLGGYR